MQHAVIRILGKVQNVYGLIIGNDEVLISRINNSGKAFK